jgi:two-component system response regulator FixJ
MTTEAIVHVIDDDDAMRDSLAFVLESAGLQARTYASATSFLDALPLEQPTCVVTDVRMPGISGIDLLRRLTQAREPAPVIVITGHGDVPLAVEAMKLGAADFIEKPFDDEVMLSAVRAALARSRVDDPEGVTRRAVAERLASLSARERQVLDGLVAGLPNKNIAFQLGISPRTVEVYRANVMTKMRASSLSELVRLALLADHAL